MALKALRIAAVAVGLVLLALLFVVLLVVVGIEIDFRAARAAVPALAVPHTPGTASGRPVVVLLHGAALNGRMWDAVRRDLDPSLRVIAPDLPGHGEHLAGTYTLQGARALVAAIARDVAPSPVVLVGDSLGGYSAIAAAYAVPDWQLKGIIVSGASANFRAERLPNWVAQALLVRGLVLSGRDQDFARRAIESLGQGAEDARALLDAGVELSALAPAVRAMMGVDFKAMLSAVEAPVLVANGELDLNAVAHEDEFVAAAAHAERYRFEGAQHGVSMRRSAEYAEVINAFTARVFAPVHAAAE